MPVNNFIAVNSRLDQAYRLQLSGLYRQHVSAMASLEHEKLDTSRLLGAIRRCPSDVEPLSIKFLGPPKRRKATTTKGQQQQQQNAVPTPRIPAESSHPATGTARAATAAVPVVAEASQQRRHQQPLRLGRSKTFAAAATATVAAADAGQTAGRHRRQGTPLPRKLERFYAELQETKLSCGLRVIDATQTEGFQRGSYTLSRADWLEKLARIDPEFFKNVDGQPNQQSSVSDEDNDDDDDDDDGHRSLVDDIGSCRGGSTFV